MRGGVGGVDESLPKSVAHFEEREGGRERGRGGERGGRERTGGRMERDKDIGIERERGREGGREAKREKERKRELAPESKILFSKDCSLGSIKN